MYTSTTRWEVIRAIGLVITVTSGIVFFFLCGGLFAWTDPAPAVVDLVVLAGGAALLYISGKRITEIWAANKPYLLSEEGRFAIRGRRELEKRILTSGRIIFAVFLVCAVVFMFLFAAIACGNSDEGYCGDFGRPPEWLVEFWQVFTVFLGALWAAAVSFRRRFEAATERIDVVVAEGLRQRRADDPMHGTGRFSWE